MTDMQPLEIKTEPLARWILGCTFLPLLAFLLARTIASYNIGIDKYLLICLLLGSLWMILDFISKKIILSADSIEIRSMVLPSKKILKKDIRSQTPFTWKGGNGLFLNPIDPTIRRVRVDLNWLSAANKERIYDFLQDIPDSETLL